MEDTIREVEAQAILDSRAKWTIEVKVDCKGGSARVAAPSGASRGRWEAVAYPKRGLETSITLVNHHLAPLLKGVHASDQAKVDGIISRFDGTRNFARLGGNPAYAISMATASSAAASLNIPLYEKIGGREASLPVPLGNIIGGGMHAAGKRTDVQEFLVFSIGCTNLHQAAALNSELHKRVGKALDKNRSLRGQGDEGGWIADLHTEQVLDILSSNSENLGQEYGVRVCVGMDVAASTLWSPREHRYIFRRDRIVLDGGQQLDRMVDLQRKYGLCYLEDPFHDEDFAGFAQLCKKVKKCLIAADDLYVTRPQRARHGARSKSSNALIIKVNQVGTLSVARETSAIAEQNRWVRIASHRSGETVGSELAHVAIGFGAGLIKCGVCGGERVEKLNELLRIESRDRVPLTKLGL